jgi:hypothetical protein
MELKEAFDIIDATLGMFRSIEEEVENGPLKDKFLLIPVYSSIENYFDADKNSFELGTRTYYNYVDCGKEYKRYIVDIRPVCSYMINEWPSHKAKKIRKLLNEVLLQCVALCKETLGEIINIALDEGYGYDKYMRTQDSRTLETVLLDTIHEMSRALGLTEYAEPEDQEEQIYINDDRIISEDVASQMDWIKATNNFNPATISDLVKNIGKSKREKKIVVKAIYDAMSRTGYMYKIPYHVDKLLDDLYRKFDKNHKSIIDAAYNESTETLYFDVMMKNAIEKYIDSHSATNADIDEIFSDGKLVEGKNTEEEKPDENLSPIDQLIIKAIEIMKKENVIKHLYDYAFIMQIMNETEELPTYSSPKSFLDYFKGLKITNLPGEDSIKKKVNATFGNHPSWTFTDKKGIDANEVKRRNAIGSRFLSIYRKGK